MDKNYSAVVIGVSAGGMDALSIILKVIPADFQAPVIIVQHVSPYSDNYLVQYLDNICKIKVKEAEDKEKIKPGNVYIAPPNYHLLIETDHSLSLSVDEKVNYARPSIDVLFETAADAYGQNLVGVILTGANKDGSMGLKTIKKYGGLAVVQSPDTALADEMPRCALAVTNVDFVLPLEKIGSFLCALFGRNNV